MLKETNDVYQALFGTDLQSMTKSGSIGIQGGLASLDKELAKAKDEYIKAVKKHLEYPALKAKADAELANCNEKLAQLKVNAGEATKLTKTAHAPATAAVDFVEQAYQEVASGSTLVDAVGDPKAKSVMKKKGAGKKTGS